MALQSPELMLIFLSITTTNCILWAVGSQYIDAACSNLTHLTNVVSALYTYEHLVTLDSEIQLFWRRKAFVSVLFLLNRYLQLLNTCVFPVLDIMLVAYAHVVSTQ